MTIRRIGLLLITSTALACSDRGGNPGDGNGDDDPQGPTIDAPEIPIDAPGIDSRDGCGHEPTGDWSGVARMRSQTTTADGITGTRELRAEVRWTHASTEGCVDRYRPSGTMTYLFSSGCGETVDPPTRAIVGDDGELRIDRTTSPPTFRVRGETYYYPSITCAGAPTAPRRRVGGYWVFARGWFDGAVIAGGATNGGSAVIEWQFARVDTAFPPPAGCSEPSTERWAGTAQLPNGSAAEVTWTRVETVGCVDRYQPQGTATEMPANLPDCRTVVREPASTAVAASHGTLTIDRTTSPPTFDMQGRTAWSGKRTCTHFDGSVEVFQGELGGSWARFKAAFDGNDFGGRTADQAWGLRRQ